MTVIIVVMAWVVAVALVMIKPRTGQDMGARNANGWEGLPISSHHNVHVCNSV